MGYAFNFENLKNYTPVVRDITIEYLDKWVYIMKLYNFRLSKTHLTRKKKISKIESLLQLEK